MIVPVLVIVALLTALTGALLDNTRRAATIALHETVARYGDAALSDGVADFSGGLAQYVEAHGTGGPWPQATSRSARKTACGSAPAACPFSYVISAAITGSSGPVTSGTDAAANVQAAAIDEQRISATVTAQIIGADGTVRGYRTRLLTYRVFEAPPFAVISGVHDEAADDGIVATAAGDSGGAIGTLPAAAADARADDTRIHVRLTCATVIPNVMPFTNDQQPAGNDGLPWGNAAQAAYETPCTAPDVPADTFTSETWTNGDAAAAAGSR